MARILTGEAVAFVLHYISRYTMSGCPPHNLISRRWCSVSMTCKEGWQLWLLCSEQILKVPFSKDNSPIVSAIISGKSTFPTFVYAELLEALDRANIIKTTLPFILLSRTILLDYTAIDSARYLRENSESIGLLMEGRGTQKWKLDNLVGTNYQGFVLFCSGMGS